MDGEVGTKAFEERHHQVSGVAAYTAHGEQHQGYGDSADDLQSQFLRGGEAEISPLDDLDVVIGKADGRKGHGGTHHQPYERIGKVAPQHCRKKDSDADEHAAHGGGSGLLLVVFGTIFPDVLTDLKLAQLLDHERPDEQGDEHRGETGESGAKRQIPENAEGSEVGKKFLIKEPVKQTSSAIRLWLSYSRWQGCLYWFSTRTIAATSVVSYPHHCLSPDCSAVCVRTRGRARNRRSLHFATLRSG